MTGAAYGTVLAGRGFVKPVSTNAGVRSAAAEAGRDGPSSGASVTPSRLVVVVNRKARAGGADLGPVLESLADRLGPAEVLEVDDPAELAAKLEQACGDAVQRVVVAGGDGTINSVLPVLLRIGKPLGIIPLGTANDLARTLGIPVDPAAAAAVILQDRKRRIDVGVVNGKHFVNAAGIGFSTGLHRELTPRIKGVLGPLAYAIGVLRRWRRHEPFSVLVRTETSTLRRRVIQVTVANGRYYGGGMTAHEGARIDDGSFDVVMILARPWWQHLSSAIRLKRGVYANEGTIAAERASAFELSTRSPRTVATDGEPRTRTPASFRVLPRALEVYVPDDAP
ncbi:MAG TPA: lipid kinase [Gammaproteobacteria bacterium]